MKMHWQDECGVMGVLGDPEASYLTYLGLYALQHRGQEAAGIISLDHESDQPEPIVHEHKAFGLVADAFSSKDVLARLKGSLAVGHVRYSTQGGRLIQNIQPFIFRSPRVGPVTLAHNGNITNAKQLRRELEEAGSIFSSTSDSEVLSHLIARSRKRNFRERIIETISQVKGGYSLVVGAESSLFAIRDPLGLRPLVIGKKGKAWIVASETCALDLIEAEYVREVAPGELVELKEAGIYSEFPQKKQERAFCSFEPIYFSRPDSIQDGTSVYDLRRKMGEVLSKEHPVEADVVIAIPDSGVPMALGYGHAAGIDVELGLVRNHYVGRTFIEPSQSIRDFGVKLKLNAVSSVLKDKKVVVIDDSIVRGTTSTKIVRMLRAAGAKEIHFRIGSPPITHSCHYGVATPNRRKLLAAQKDVSEICRLLGADTLGYLSREGLLEALQHSGYCTACFTGEYPEEIFENIEPQPTDETGPGLFAKVEGAVWNH